MGNFRNYAKRSSSGNFRRAIICILSILWYFFLFVMEEKTTKNKTNILAVSKKSIYFIINIISLFSIFCYALPELLKKKEREFWEKINYMPVIVMTLSIMVFAYSSAAEIYCRSELTKNTIDSYNFINTEKRRVSQWADVTEYAVIGIYKSSGKHTSYHPYLKIHLKDGKTYTFKRFYNNYNICTFYDEYKDRFYIERDSKYLDKYTRKLSVEKEKLYYETFYQ